MNANKMRRALLSGLRSVALTWGLVAILLATLLFIVGAMALLAWSWQSGVAQFAAVLALYVSVVAFVAGVIAGE